MAGFDYFMATLSFIKSFVFDRTNAALHKAFEYKIDTLSDASSRIIYV